ncbi:MAG TPA: DUF4235 domain-containing protein [Micromonosporaceae bacterium]|nr:DUF4235 domain-containing protein [Micromonosporaceae bacterium]
MSRVIGKLAYKPVGMLLGGAAAVLAALLFKQVWRAVSGTDDAPRATDEDRRWAEILAAAALQGAIFGAVHAAVDRGGATAVRRVTGRWPG